MSDATTGPAAEVATDRATWTLPQRLVGVAGHVARLPRGPRAILRRLGQRPGEVPPDEFWAIVDKYAIQPADEAFWAAVLPLMVVHQHGPTRPGDALALAGVKDARVERWLRFDAARARAEARRLLARVERGLDWADFGQLLYCWTDERRRGLARQFFLSKHRPR